MTTESLETTARKLLEIGNRLNRLVRNNQITSETFSTNRDKSNSKIERLVNEYNEIAEEVTNSTEYTIQQYVISEKVNSNGQKVVTATNK